MVTEKEKTIPFGWFFYLLAEDRIWDTKLSEFTLSLVNPSDFIS